MALVVMSDETVKMVSAEQGAAIWSVLNCEVEPESEAQEAFCLRVKDIYLSKYNAPASYLEKHHITDEVNYANIMGARNV